MLHFLTVVDDDYTPHHLVATLSQMRWDVQEHRCKDDVRTTFGLQIVLCSLVCPQLLQSSVEIFTVDVAISSRFYDEMIHVFDGGLGVSI